MRSIYIFLLTILFIVGIAASIGHADTVSAQVETPAPECQPINISNRDGFADYPYDMDNHRVTFIGNDNVDDEIFVYDVASEISTQITDNAYDDWTPVIDGDHVFWFGDTATADWEVYIYDLTTDIETNVSNDPTHENINVMIDGNYALWIDTDTAQETIYLYDIVAKTSKVLATGKVGPLIGDYIVYRPDATTDLYLYTISTDTHTLVTDTLSPSSVWDVVISGDHLVWDSWDGNDDEVYLYQISTATTTNISNNNGNSDIYPEIEGNYVSWIRNNGVEDEIYLYDISLGTATNISNNANYNDFGTVVENGYVMFHGHDGNDEEIYLYDTNTGITTNISNNDTDGDVLAWDDVSYYWISSNGYFAWVSSTDGGTTYDYFVYDVNSDTNTLIATGVTATDLLIQDNLITWRQFDGNDYEVYLYDASCEPPVVIDPLPVCEPVQISNEPGFYSNMLYGFSGNYIVWNGGDGNDGEIFYYDVSTGMTTRATNDDYEDFFPIIDGQYIAWQKEMTDLTTGVALYDIATTTEINVSEYPSNDLPEALGGNHLLWNGTDGQDEDVFLYDISTGVNTNISDNDTSLDMIGWQIINNRFVWSSYDSGQYTLYLHDIGAGISTPISTQNIYDFSNAAISDTHVVWVAEEGSEYNVYLYDIDAKIPLNISNTTGFTYSETYVVGNYVAWLGNDGTDTDLYLYDITTESVTNLSNTATYNEEEYQLYEGHIVWHGHDGNDEDIFLYDMSTGITTNVSNNDVSSEILGYRGGLRRYSTNFDTLNTVVWVDSISNQAYAYDVSTGTTRDVIGFNYGGGIFFGEDYLTWVEPTDGEDIVYFYDLNCAPPTIELPPVTPETCTALNISQNPAGVDGAFQRYGDYIVMLQYDGNDDEIVLYNVVTGEKTQVTNDNYNHGMAYMSGNTLGYMSMTDTTSEIFVYDVVTGVTTNISNVAGHEFNILYDIQGDYVLWRGDTDTGGGLDMNNSYIYNIVDGTHTEVIFNGNPVNTGYLTSDYFIWTDGSINDTGSYLYNLAAKTHTNLSEWTPTGYTAVQNIMPGVSGDYAVWTITDDLGEGDREIYLYNLTTGVGTLVTNDATNDSEPSFYWDDRYIVWTKSVGGDSEIYLYDITTGASPINISNNPSRYEFDPVTSGDLVIWYEDDGNDREIVVYEISTGIKTQVTDNDYDDEHWFSQPGNTIEGYFAFGEYDGTQWNAYLFDVASQTKSLIMTDIPGNTVYTFGRYILWGMDGEVYLYHVSNCADPTPTPTPESTTEVTPEVTPTATPTATPKPIVTITINEQAFYAAIESVIANNPTIESIEFVLIDFMPPQSNAPGGMSLTIRLNDGRTGHVFVSMIADNGLIKIQIADATPNGTDPPGQIAFRQAVNSELPTILANALNSLIGEYDEIVSLTMTNDALVIEVR